MTYRKCQSLRNVVQRVYASMFSSGNSHGFGYKLPFLFLLISCIHVGGSVARAQEENGDSCPRPAATSEVPEPRDLRSQNGVLRVELAVHGYRDQDGRTRYCYVLPDGSQSPTLRLNPGDLLILKLKNDLVAAARCSMWKWCFTFFGGAFMVFVEEQLVRDLC